MSGTQETRQFQTEARQLLDLMIHSVYSHKEIFLRELISNASDALDKLRFEALKNTDLAEFTNDPHIRLTPDKEARTLTISDNGIGMSRDEVIEYIGTIAKSGSREYLKLLQEAKKSDELPPELIGQFGVGFYSSFMVADKVTMITRRAGEQHATRWESTGDGSYTLDDDQRDVPGTTITLHLIDADEEESLDDFTEEWVIKRTVKKYSDFVNYPIKMEVERTEMEKDEDGKPKEDGKEIKKVEDETLNSMKAIWTRPESEVSDEEYTEFYKHISHDWTEPMERINFKAEGLSEFRALLFIPSHAPFDLWMRDTDNHGVHLYIKRVFIMQDCKELIPEYLRFVKGVVDSEDLSLNISREILQQNRQVQTIRKGVVRKVLDTLGDMLEKDREKYTKFWDEFGRALKEGIFSDDRNREKILDLCLFNSTHDDEKKTTLAEYMERMPEGQDAIYYLTGESLDVVRKSPHLEAFREKGYEVLLLTEPVDEVWVQSVFDFKEKKFQSVGKGEVKLGSEEEQKKAEEDLKEKKEAYSALMEQMKKQLDEYIKEVRLSSRLTSSPACLVGDTMDMTPQMEQLLRASGQQVPTQKRILELNPKHPVLEKLKAIVESDKDSEMVKDYAELLHGQALLAEGQPLPDATRFNEVLNKLMTRGLIV